MSVHKRGDRWVVRFRDEDGHNRSRTFNKRVEARTFDESVRQEKRLAPAAPPTDDERYDRDFALMREGNAVRCYYPDPDWRSAMRKRGRAAGVAVRTLTNDDEGYMAAYCEGLRPPDVDAERLQHAVAKREALDWHRRRMGLAR